MKRSINLRYSSAENDVDGEAEARESIVEAIRLNNYKSKMSDR